jgi:hypothetical protein
VRIVRHPIHEYSVRYKSAIKATIARPLPHSYLSTMIAPFVVSLALSSGAAAWGNAGHQTVGYVAQEFLSAKALSNVKTLLGSTFNYSLGVAATWADTVKYEAAYTWSAPLHFVDANDSPLTGQCSVSETRDCIGNSCIRKSAC